MDGIKRQSDEELPSLALFFTLGMSLQKWDKAGILAREIKPYHLLASHFAKIYFFSYGGKDEESYQERLAPNLEVIYKRWPLPNLIYSVLIPILYLNILKNCYFLKTNQMYGSWSAVLAKMLCRNKLIVRTGFTWSKFYRRKKTGFLKKKMMLNLIRFAERIAYRHGDAAIVSSAGDKKYLLKNGSIRENKIGVIPNYVDTETFSPRRTKRLQGRVVYVGRLEPQKNLFSLIKATKNLSIGLDIIGEGSLREELEESVRKSGADVHFLGTVSNENLPAALNRYEVFVLPSFYEGMPKALLEAMSCGLACLATNVEGINEVVTNEVNGLLVEPSPLGIRKGIIRLMSDKKLREKLGRNARETITDRFSLAKMVAEELNLYRQFLN